jgi:hypothetical protein
MLRTVFIITTMMDTYDKDNGDKGVNKEERSNETYGNTGNYGPKYS